MDGFELLRRYLLGDAAPASSDFTEACQRRAFDAVEFLRGHTRAQGTPGHVCGAGCLGAPGPADLAVLVRHVLRREQEKQGGAAQDLFVPIENPWPTRQEWSGFGVDAVQGARAGYLRVSATEWRPNWLPGTSAPEQAVFAEKVRRTFDEVPGDPFLSSAGRSTYRSAWQRDALRGVLLSPPGATLVVTLPTGAGKSLLAQVPALFDSRAGGVTVVVLPTTALCLDQERAVHNLLPHPSAYVGGADEETKERNRAIRKRVRDGTQRIVFTSPESLMGSLAGALYDAASSGRFEWLIIDEAHIVEQWGDDFRSAFQEIAGVRRGLLQVCPEGRPFRTLLLTATLTESCLDTLEILFAGPGEFGLAASVQLRPEPSFYFASCASDGEKQARLLEALKHLPRPLVLYTTKVADAHTWTRTLRQAGFLRCEEVTGETPTQERRRILQLWQANRTDVVVATSAFGLGVDKEDVRVVVHACVPETVDRYYQEVGRGGRDGKASLSLVVHTARDTQLAEEMSARRIISVERGLQRWTSMFDEPGTESLGNSRFRVPLNVNPSFTGEDVDMAERTYSLEWNVRTLTLMARAGLLRLEADAPPRLPQEEGRSQDEVEQWYKTQFDRYSKRRLIQVLDQDHRFAATWKGRVEPVRQRARKLARRGFELMRDCLTGTRCIADVLADVYTIPGQSNRPGVAVAKACSGCAACRRLESPPSNSLAPYPRFPWRPQSRLEPGLGRLLGQAKLLAVFYASHEGQALWVRRRRDAFLWFAAQGVRGLVAPAKVLATCRDAFEKAQQPVFFEELRPGTLSWPVPQLIFHPSEAELPRGLYLPRSAENGLRPVPRVVFFPVEAMDPNSPHRRVKDILDCPTYSFEALSAHAPI